MKIDSIFPSLVLSFGSLHVIHLDDMVNVKLVYRMHVSGGDVFSLRSQWGHIYHELTLFVM